MQTAFIHGVLLALGLILPLGIQNFFVFSQGTIRSKFIYILPVVITASLSDTLLILLAVMGVSALISAFEWITYFLVIGGFFFLIYMGIQSWKNSTQDSNQIQDNYTIRRTITYTLMISLINPHAILDTVGVIGTSSINYQGFDKVIFTGTCIAVSWCWFFILAILGRQVGIRDGSGQIIKYLNKISAIVMWLAAVYLLRTIEW